MSLNVENQAFQEWVECRRTIARMDTILEDLRKYGFTLITGLLTASAFLGAGTGKPDAGVAAFVAVMVLVTALFSVDTYYSAALSGAVERALDLEARSDPPIRITNTIYRRREQAGVVRVTLYLYVALLAVASGLGIAYGAASAHAALLVPATAGLGLVLLLVMIRYWRGVTDRTGMEQRKPRAGLEAEAVPRVTSY